MTAARHRSSRIPGRAALAAIAWVGSIGASAAEQAPPTPTPAPETFPVAVEQVIVDVVVADRRGEPVSGLTEADFTVLEDGRPQKIASFDVIRGEAATDGRPAEASAAAAPPFVATNTSPVARGRTFVIVFDNVHMSPLGARSAKAAVASFLERTRPTDQVLLVSTGEGFWWTARAGSGRADLLTVLKGLDGRRFPQPAGDRLTDYEAVQISVYHDVRVAAQVMARFDRHGGSSRQGMEMSRQNNPAQGAIDMYVSQRALEAYLEMRRRLDLTLGLIERSCQALAEGRDRKTVILVSEGFAHDPSNRRFRTVAEAARRVNAAVYFIDTRGLESLSSHYSAEFGAPISDAERLGAIADIGREGDGAASLAQETGGFAVRNSNDFASGIVRIGRESESYYLLGYAPAARTGDGRFHKIDVKVRGRGYVVRARKGYYDDPGGSGAEPPPVAGAPRERSDPALQRALDSPALLGAVPLRMSAYTLASALDAKAQVVLAADADVSGIAFGEGTGNALLDTLLVVAAPDGGVQRTDRQVELQRRASPPGGGPVWYSFVRDFELGAGRHQAKLVVRDVATGQIGTVSHTFEVPPLDGLRLSTPLLTDTLQKDTLGVVAPTMLARREFARDAQLYCLFEVFGAAKGPDGLPRVRAGHEVRRRGGSMVGRTAPTPVAPTSIGAVTRLIQIPLSIVGPGDYDLVLTVTDEITGRQVERVEPFVVTPVS
jgi:VWFA-related protein